MQQAMRVSEFCHLHAERAVTQRREAKEAESLARGTTLLAAMLIESKVVDEILGPMNLSYVEKLEYITENSVFIRSADGHEAIQIVITPDQAICIHRLLSKEFRNEFNASWLGVWCEPLKERDIDGLVKVMHVLVKRRDEHRQEFGINGELNFSA